MFPAASDFFRKKMMPATLQRRIMLPGGNVNLLTSLGAKTRHRICKLIEANGLRETVQLCFVL